MKVDWQVTLSGDTSKGCQTRLIRIAKQRMSFAIGLRRPFQGPKRLDGARSYLVQRKIHRRPETVVTRCPYFAEGHLSRSPKYYLTRIWSELLNTCMSICDDRCAIIFAKSVAVQFIVSPHKTLISSRPIGHSEDTQYTTSAPLLGLHFSRIAYKALVSKNFSNGHHLILSSSYGLMGHLPASSTSQAHLTLGDSFLKTA
jgi:hypothetical protein